VKGGRQGGSNSGKVLNPEKEEGDERFTMKKTVQTVGGYIEEERSSEVCQNTHDTRSHSSSPTVKQRKKELETVSETAG